MAVGPRTTVTALTAATRPPTATRRRGPATSGPKRPTTRGLSWTTAARRWPSTRWWTAPVRSSSCSGPTPRSWRRTTVRRRGKCAGWSWVIWVQKTSLGIKRQFCMRNEGNICHPSDYHASFIYSCSLGCWLLPHMLPIHACLSEKNHPPT